jgi:IS5 family transposase
MLNALYIRLNSDLFCYLLCSGINIHDSKTLDLALGNAVSNVGEEVINEAITDRGYRGTKEVTINKNTISISIPGIRLKRDTKKQINIKREKFKRRAAIEPIIGHVKSDHRMARNYLKGFKGDEINLLLAATAFNLKKWMNIYLYALFIQDFTLLLNAMQQIQRLKSLYQILTVLKLYF